LHAFPTRRSSDLPAAGAVALRRRVRPARRGDAAERPERSGDVADLDAEGRAAEARPHLLREARARQGDVPGAADDSVLPRGLGRAARRRTAAAEPPGAG